MNNSEKAAVKVFTQEFGLKLYSEISEAINSITPQKPRPLYLTPSNIYQLDVGYSMSTQGRYLVLESSHRDSYLAEYFVDRLHLLESVSIARRIPWVNGSDVDKIKKSGIDEDTVNVILKSLIGVLWNDLTSNQDASVIACDGQEHEIDVHGNIFYVYRLD